MIHHVTFKSKFIVLMVSDINECAEMNGGCQQLCFNTDGSRLCSCKHGYTLNSDGYSCDGEYHTPTTSYFLFLVFLFVFNWSDTLLYIHTSSEFTKVYTF